MEAYLVELWAKCLVPSSKQCKTLMKQHNTGRTFLLVNQLVCVFFFLQPAHIKLCSSTTRSSRLRHSIQRYIMHENKLYSTFDRH